MATFRDPQAEIQPNRIMPHVHADGFETDIEGHLVGAHGFPMTTVERVSPQGRLEVHELDHPEGVLR